MRDVRLLLVCCLAACLGPWAGSSLRAGQDPDAPGDVRREYLEELHVILEETKSPDAFMLTLRCLADEKADARLLVPLAIRNAERLGILADHAGKEGREVERAATFAEMLERIHKQMPRVPSYVPADPQIHIRCAPPSSKKAENPSDVRTPIIANFEREGSPPSCDDPPSEAVILRKLPSLPRGLKYVLETSRDDVQVVTELVKDDFGEQRFFPLVGPARLHHCYWKCTVYYNETIESRHPFPFRYSRPRVSVVYVDRDALHVEGAEKTSVRDCRGR